MGGSAGLRSAGIVVRESSWPVAGSKRVRRAPGYAPIQIVPSGRSQTANGAVLPASIDVMLKPGFRDPATVKRVAARVKAFSFVDDVRYGEEWIQKCDARIAQIVSQQQGR